MRTRPTLTERLKSAPQMPSRGMAKRDLIAHVQAFEISKTRVEAALQMPLAAGQARVTTAG